MQPFSAPTSFCVTVSMMVPKAGMVDILTELEARKGFTIYAQMCQRSDILTSKKIVCVILSADGL